MSPSVTFTATDASGHQANATASYIITSDGQTPSARLGHFDSFRGTTGAYSANKVVSDLQVSAGGSASQIMHAYSSSGSDWATSYASSKVATSGEFGHAFLFNQGIPGGSLAGVVSGSQDSQIAAWFNSVPITETCYVTMNSEPENDGISSVDFCKAMARVVNVAAPIYASRGLKGGVGGLLMGGSFKPPNDPVAKFNTWNWLQYVNPSAMGCAVYMVDCYSKYLDDQASTYESIPDIVNRAFDQARAKGCHRFVIGEFANSRERRNAGGLIVADSADQEHWINIEVPKIRAISGIEAALYFAKPTGQESKNAQLVDDSVGKPLTAYARII